MLEVRNATVRYGGHTVVDDVSLSLKRGSFVGILGPNGAGKSSLLRSILGIVPLQAGEILIDGKPLGSYGRRELARTVSYLPQSASPPFPFAAREMVRMGRYPHLQRFQGEDEQDAILEEALKDAGAWNLQDKLITELSGGELKRVHLARTFATQAPAMLLDEPLANLDVHYMLDVMAILRRKRDEGALVVMTLHDLNHAYQACDEVALMSQGKLVAYGDREEVFVPRLLEEVFCVEVQVLSQGEASVLHFQRKPPV